jgi:hypothetical protein
MAQDAGDRQMCDAGPAVMRDTPRRLEHARARASKVAGVRSGAVLATADGFYCGQLVSVPFV